MSATIQAFPLQWPPGWPRAKARAYGRFGTRERRSFDGGGGGYSVKNDITVSGGVERVLRELERMGIERQDVVISSNVRVRMDGLPRSGEKKPDDPGVAVYWEDRGSSARRVMAIDRYTDVADNLAAVAATLEAMRAIDRHGGAQILERAFTGFAALPAPGDDWKWRERFQGKDAAGVDRAYRALAQQHHPDRGGDEKVMASINRARDDALENLRAG